MCVYVYIYICIYIYPNRKKKQDIYIYVYIYIYTYTHSFQKSVLCVTLAKGPLVWGVATMIIAHKAVAELPAQKARAPNADDEEAWAAMINTWAAAASHFHSVEEWIATVGMP